MRRRRSSTDGFINLGVFGEYPDALWVQWSKETKQIKWRSLYHPQEEYKTSAIKSATQVEAKAEVQKLLAQRDEMKRRQLLLL